MQNPVLLGVPAALADEEPVVEDVVVRQGRALREAGGPAGVLDVDRVVERQAGLALGQQVTVAAVGGDGLAGLEERVPLRRADEDHVFQRGQVRPDLPDHGPVVTGLEALGADQDPNPRLAQGVAKLVAAVRRVDVDQDDARLGRRVLQLHPFGAVGRPDPDPVAGRQPGGDQAAGEHVGLRVERRVSPPAARGDVHEHLGIRVCGGDAPQVGADRLAQQRGR